MAFRFEKLTVWHEARKFVNAIYKVTLSYPAAEKFAIVDQLRRAALSILLNITEGSDRKSDLEFRRFLRMSITSTEEVVAALYVSLDQGYIQQEKFDLLYKQANSLVAQLNSLVNSMKL